MYFLMCLLCPTSIQTFVKRIIIELNALWYRFRCPTRCNGVKRQFFPLPRHSGRLQVIDVSGRVSQTGSGVCVDVICCFGPCCVLVRAPGLWAAGKSSNIMTPAWPHTHLRQADCESERIGRVAWLQGRAAEWTPHLKGKSFFPAAPQWRVKDH